MCACAHAVVEKLLYFCTHWVIVAEPGRKAEVPEIIKLVSFCEYRKLKSFSTDGKAAAHAQFSFDTERIHLGKRMDVCEGKLQSELIPY